MSLMLQSQFQDDLDLRIAAKDYFVDAFNQYPMHFPEYFYVTTSQLKSDTTSELGGFSAPSSVGEGSDLPEVSAVEGYDTTFTHALYGQTPSVSYQLQQDDPKGIMQNIQTYAQMHARAMQTAACKLAANVLINGWATAGPDGQYLLDTDHPTSPTNSTQLSNMITTKLDSGGNAVSELVAKAANNGRDMAGNQINYATYVLVVPPALKNNALKSCVALYGVPFAISNYGGYAGVVGGTEAPSPIQTGEIFRTNTQTGSAIKVVEEPFIGSGYTGGSDVTWYLIASPADAGPFHSLRFYWRERPRIATEAMIVQKNLALPIPGICRMSAAPLGWRHVWGSNGTA